MKKLANMYETPTPEELKTFMVTNNLTGADIAAMTGVNPRAARRWVAPADHKDSRSIPWAAWVLIQIFTGIKSVNDIIMLIDSWKQEKIGIGLFDKGKPGRRWPEGKNG